MTHCRVALGWIDRYETHVGSTHDGVLRGFRPWRKAVEALRVGTGWVLSVFVFSSSSLKQVKGSRFNRGLAGKPWPNSAAAEPHCEKGNPGFTGQPRADEPGTGTGTAEKDRRSIRCPARIRPLDIEPEPVSSLYSCGRAPALHACECLTIHRSRGRPPPSAQLTQRLREGVTVAPKPRQCSVQRGRVLLAGHRRPQFLAG